jgi:hypothetical protein
LTLTGASGTSGQVLTSGGSGAAPSWSTLTGITSGTAVASTSGTSIDFTGIPSTAKRITVMFDAVSSNSTSFRLIQIGTGGVPTTSGYVSATNLIYSATNVNTATTGFVIFSDSSPYKTIGTYTICNVSGNTWIMSGVSINTETTPFGSLSAGNVTLSGVLNMIRITSVNGTDTFDAGSINIFYE